MIQRPIPSLAATLAAALLAGCGGGGSTGGSTLTPTTPATTAPVVTPAPVTAPAAQPLITASLNGSPGFVNKASHTVYEFDADLATPNVSACSGQCAAVWPPIAVPSATTAVPAPFTVITRGDGTFQLAYSGHPLYTYIADSAAGTTAGDDIESFGATWHIARPAASGSATPTPVPGTTNPPSSNY